MLGKMQTLILMIRSKATLRYGKKKGIQGLEFAYFARRIAYKLLIRNKRGLVYLLTPVNLTRYFEFPFAFTCLPKLPGRWLDVSSPRLFSLYAAQAYPGTSILMINPDQNDLNDTIEIISNNKIMNIITKCAGVDAITYRDNYDCIWSISVIEHIFGEYDDKFAINKMYDSLSKGGKLIVTVPVDRKFWNEYRNDNYYGTQKLNEDGKYFFQRWYDKKAIWERLVSSTGKEPTVVRWFGETVNGRFAEYVRRWMRDGHNCTVDDPKEVANYYKEFQSWEQMPGMGVCGLMFEKGNS